MTITDLDAAPSDALLLRVSDAARLLNMSRTVICEQLRSRRLESVKQGRTRLIPQHALRKYVELLVTEADTAPVTSRRT